MAMGASPAETVAVTVCARTNERGHGLRSYQRGNHRSKNNSTHCKERPRTTEIPATASPYFYLHRPESAGKPQHRKRSRGWIYYKAFLVNKLMPLASHTMKTNEHKCLALKQSMGC